MNIRKTVVGRRVSETLRTLCRASRHSRKFGIESLQPLESRQLLASFSMSFSATVPTQPTDYTVSTSLPKFDPSLGTLNSVDLTFATSGTQQGSLTNVGQNPESFSFQENVGVSLSDGTTTLASPNLSESQNYTDLTPFVATAFGPFAPSDSASVEYTSGPQFEEFEGGPGNQSLTVTTLTTNVTTGGGGNVRQLLTTTAGATATVTYNYTAAPVTLSGNVYEDTAGAGALQPGDPPIPNVLLTLVDASGSTVATTTTASNGTYSFSDSSSGSPLAAGTYEIEETQPTGYLQGTNTVGTVNGVTDGTLPSQDVIGSIVLTSGQNSINNNFGELLPVSISGTVYDDVLKAGVLLPGDLPIPGTTVTLFDSSGVVATTTTNAYGVYSFTTTSTGNPLPPNNDYTLVEAQPAGYQQGTNTIGTVNGVIDGTQPVQDIFTSIVLNSSQNSINNNFGEIQNVSSPTVTTVDRFGVHDQPTVIYLTFSTPLDPTTAQSVANYQISGPTDSKSPGLVPITSAVYNASTDSVTLNLGERLQVHHPYTLTVNGLTSSTGALLVGSNGQVGSPFVTTLSRTSLAGFTDIYGTFVPIDHGKLYPAASAAGYQHKKFVAPAKLGSFASANTAAYQVATGLKGEIPPITLKGKKPIPPANGGKKLPEPPTPKSVLPVNPPKTSAVKVTSITSVKAKSDHLSS
jgi:hypothetical protein